MSISLIVAASANNAIGKNGRLLWHLPIDLTFFKDTTWGMPVIMGRKTFEAVNKPLPGRINIVITSQQEWNTEGVTIVKSLEEAIREGEATNCKELFIIGGGEIYKQSMGITDKIYMTRVHQNLEGDTFFPVIDEKDWKLEKNIDFNKDEKHAYPFSIQTWVKQGSNN
ncbi:MAG TPA: dihydrofolate reductase [Ferruginibacter sp.]|nr:dihydrofolate reductase [Ferruginibacter sp.]